MKMMFSTDKTKVEIQNNITNIQSINIRITNKNELKCISGRNISYWKYEIEEGTFAVTRRFSLIDIIEVSVLGIIYAICIYIILLGGITLNGLLLILSIGLIEFVFYYSIEYLLPKRIVKKFIEKNII